MDNLQRILAENPRLAERLVKLKAWSKSIRSSEYHVTHACNIRCKGCWFFEFGFDEKTGKDVKELDRWDDFARRESERGVSLALLIGGEPTLFPDRVAAFVQNMKYVWVSTNGLDKLPVSGFENVAVAITLFGGGPLDDDLRGIRPNGKRFSGLFETALQNYRHDPRAFFVYALTNDSAPYIEDVVKRAGDAGIPVQFNYYTEYSGAPGSLNAILARPREERLIEAALRVRESYPHVVLSHPYYIQTSIRGQSHWARFGYDVCPSVSQAYEGNHERLANGNPALPGFNVIAPDLKTVNMCCTSGHCDQCRDSQAVLSWLMVSMEHFLESDAQLETWVEICESFWRQFLWSPYHWTRSAPSTFAPAPAPALASLSA